MEKKLRMQQHPSPNNYILENTEYSMYKYIIQILSVIHQSGTYSSSTKNVYNEDQS